MNKQLRRFACLILALCLLPLSGCGKRYRVDYGGDKEDFVGAKDSYFAGQKVTLTFPYIATDTDYRFTLDGDTEGLKVDYSDAKGYILTFTMPEHDVKVGYTMTNSMMWDGGDTGVDWNPGDMLVDYYRSEGAGEDAGYREWVLSATDDPDWADLTVYEKEGDAEEAVTAYRVPFFVARQAWDQIEANDLASWAEDPDAVALDGAKTVVRFVDRYSGTYYRASTEAMPEDGEAILDAIGGILIAAATQENLVGCGME